MSNKSDKFIINARHVITPQARRRDKVLTFILWLAYVYLWLPLVSLAAWYIGVRFAYVLVEEAGGPANLVSLLTWFGIFSLCITVVVVSWSQLQRFRFAKKDRRTRIPFLDPNDELAYWQIEPDIREKLRIQKRLSVELDSDGKLVSVE